MVSRFQWDEHEGGWCDRNGELFGERETLVRATDYDVIAAQLAEAERLLREAGNAIEGYKRAGYLTNPARAEHATDLLARIAGAMDSAGASRDE
jgi:hypothetical protein